ncbi:MAG: DUF167 domain-containing protein [Acidimicrobiia bacterium]
MIIAARDGAYINVHVQPGARNSRIAGRYGDALKVSVREPPTEGRANSAVAEMLASWLGVAAERITLVAGRTSRKTLLRCRNRPGSRRPRRRIADPGRLTAGGFSVRLTRLRLGA